MSIYFKHSNSFLARHLLVVLLSVSFLIPVVAQDTEGEGDGSGEPGLFFNTFLDWVVLSYATYTGELDAEASSFFSKTLDRYKNQPQLQSLLNGIQSSSTDNQLENSARELFNNTGIRIYYVAAFAGERKWYAEKFNALFLEKLKNQSSPYILVKSLLSGGDENYSVSIQVEASNEIKLSDYNLNAQGGSNPFRGATGSFNTRLELGAKLRDGLVAGTSALAATMTENFLPDLVISYDGDYYKSGEEIEVGIAEGLVVELAAVTNQGGLPRRAVEWTITPEDTAAIIDNNILRMPASEPGIYEIVAKAGREELAITLALIDFNPDWREILKNILKEVVNTSIQMARDKIDSLNEQQTQTQQAIEQTNDEYLESQGFPTEEVSNVEIQVYFEDVEDERLGTQADLTALRDNETTNQLIESHRRFFLAAARLALQVNIEDFLSALIDDPQALDQYVQEIKDGSPELIVQLVINIVRQPENRTQLSTIVTDFLNDKIAQAADDE